MVARATLSASAISVSEWPDARICSTWLSLAGVILDGRPPRDRAAHPRRGIAGRPGRGAVTVEDRLPTRRPVFEDVLEQPVCCGRVVA